MNRHRPTILALTRQNVPVLDRAVLAPAAGLLRGAYVLNPAEFAGQPDILLMATGSEVQLILEAGKLLAAKGIKARLVSMPCWELFREQPAEYVESVIPKQVTARVAVETGVTLGWHEWIGHRGAVVTLDRFGASAPGPRLMKEFGFTAENIVKKATALL
jgi:transketolase